jgi:acetate kinase
VAVLGDLGMRILVVNAGSSSLKLRLLDPDDTVAASRDLPAPRGRADQTAAAEAIQGFGGVEAVGHRVVHGGTMFSKPAVIDGDVVTRLRSLTDLAPLHQAKSLAGMDLVNTLLPDVPAVACFDTAFHASIPAAAATYALPAAWRQRWDLKRYGFHGLSHAYVSHRAADLLGQDPRDLRIVTCHLGAGASVAAVQGGRSVDTTMGFTPLEGLVMATRSGSVDPGLVLWLEEHVGTPAAELAATLEHRSGLLGLTGTADMRTILERADGGDPDARLGLDVYVHRLRSAIASMATSMNGLDVLVFAGGVGENAPDVRRRAAEGVSFLGVSVDRDRNFAAGDREIGVEGAPIRTMVIAAREDLQIAKEVRQTLQA